MSKNSRVGIIYFSKSGIQFQWDTGVQDRLREKFGLGIIATHMTYDLFSGRRLLQFDIPSNVDPLSVKIEIRKFFKNRRVTGVQIELFSDTVN